MSAKKTIMIFLSSYTMCHIHLSVSMTEVWDLNVRNNRICECIHKFQAAIHVEPHRSDLLKHILN